MRKFSQLILLPLLSGMFLIVFVAVVFAGPVNPGRRSDRPAGPANGRALNEATRPDGGQAPARPAAQEGSDIVITPSDPIYAGFRAFLTATVSSGSVFERYRYVWDFGDGSDLIVSNNVTTSVVVSHTYDLAGGYTVSLLVFDQNNALLSTETLPLIVQPPPFQVHLPLVVRKFGAPDLECSAIQVQQFTPPLSEENGIFITVTLKSLVAAADGFWVDFYINPTITPTVNQTWKQLCGAPCAGGIAWPVSDSPLGVDQSRALVSVPANYAPNGFDPANSDWSGMLPTGAYTFYAYVDSFSPTSDQGVIVEVTEENNLCGPVKIEVEETTPLKLHVSEGSPPPARPQP